MPYQSMALAASRPRARLRRLPVLRIANDWLSVRESLCARYRLSAAAAEGAVEASRVAWLAADEAGWTDAHGHYPAVMADLREAYRTSLLAKPTVYVLAATRDEATRADRRRPRRRRSERLAARYVTSRGRRQTRTSWTACRARCVSS